jgi:signal transduction histidine kinase
MKAALASAGASAVVLIFTWLALQSCNDERRLTHRTLYVLEEFTATESALHRDVLRARAGILRNYDPLVQGVNELDRAVGVLRELATLDAEKSAVEQLSTALDEQEKLIEDFKSKNALLQNSLTYFSLFSSRLGSSVRSPELLRSVSGLATATLHLTLDPSIAVAEVDRALQALSTLAATTPPNDDIVAIMAHASLLRRLLPETDRLVNRLHTISHGDARGDFRALVVGRQEAAERTSQRARLLLTAVSVILICLIIRLARSLQRHATALRRRAELERAIARNSTRLINSRAHETAADVVQALRELTECIGADRGYVVVLNGGSAVAHHWSRLGTSLPEGWPEKVMNFAIPREGDPAQVIYATREAPPEASDPCHAFFVESGLRGWICVPGLEGERVNGVLAFDALQTAPVVSADEVVALRMAFNAIASALNRDKLESERARFEKSLEHARRIETIGALTSGIAHNFNNIVGAILGYAEMGLAGAKPGSPLARNVEEIRRAAERARDLVDQILRFGRRGGALRRRAIAVKSLLDETQSLLRATLPPSVSLAVNAEVEEATVSGEAAQLQQVILNLCNNSAQAIDGEGWIRVEAAVLETTDMIELSHGRLSPGRYVTIAVADNGRGMSDQTLEHAFAPFFTTRKAGNGLGLATVREIVLDHGGALSVESALGGGTRIEVWLPAQRLAPDVLQPPRICGGGQTILLLDLDSERLLQNEERVAALGYEPVGFSSLDEAQRASADPERFDAIIVCHRSTAALLKLAAALRSCGVKAPMLLAATKCEAFGLDALVETEIAGLLRLPLQSSQLAEALSRALDGQARAPGPPDPAAAGLRGAVAFG